MAQSSHNQILGSCFPLPTGLRMEGCLWSSASRPQAPKISHLTMNCPHRGVTSSSERNIFAWHSRAQATSNEQKPSRDTFTKVSEGWSLLAHGPVGVNLEKVPSQKPEWLLSMQLATGGGEQGFGPTPCPGGVAMGEISFLSLSISSASFLRMETHFPHLHCLPSWAYESPKAKAVALCCLSPAPPALPAVLGWTDL